MINLLEETLSTLEAHNKTLTDIEYISFQVSVETLDGKGFENIDIELDIDLNTAFDFKYDNGLGGNYVNHTLKLVGKDFWLERGEYDGSEWWEFKSFPKKPKQKIKQTKFIKHDHAHETVNIKRT